jgi:hypothetical protein
MWRSSCCNLLLQKRRLLRESVKKAKTGKGAVTLSGEVKNWKEMVNHEEQVSYEMAFFCCTIAKFVGVSVTAH